MTLTQPIDVVVDARVPGGTTPSSWIYAVPSDVQIALSQFLTNQTSVEQEVVHPDGGIEFLEPPNPSLSPDDFEPDRFMYLAASWYDQVGSELARLEGDWKQVPADDDAPAFSAVARDDRAGITTFWTVRGVGATRPRWSLQIERDGVLTHSQTIILDASAVEMMASAEDRGEPAERHLRKSCRGTTRRFARSLHFLEHLVSLGVRSTQEYIAWCSEHGFSPDRLKTAATRAQECKAFRSAARAASIEFQETVASICDGTATEGDLRTGALRLISGAFAGGLAGGARRAFRDVLLVAEERAHLFDLEPATPALGPKPGNTFVEGLAELARRYKHWLRDPADWQPDAFDPGRQFATLARHLVARYDVPTFMDAAWMRGRSEWAQRQQGWFLHIACGGNIRTSDLPVSFTKKMAHHFLLASPDLTIEEAIRWGQVVGQGGSNALAGAVISRLGASYDNEPFWSSVIQFFIGNAVDPERVGPLVDYVEMLKFLPQESYRPGGELEIKPPPEPNFSVRGRSLDKLIGQMEAWHEYLAREDRAPKVEWRKAEIGNFVHEEIDTRNGRRVTWTITELLSQRELSAEGAELHHCVSVYAKNCRNGKTTIWSLQVKAGKGRPRRLATVEVDPKTRKVTQLRGRYNMMPDKVGRKNVGQDKRYMEFIMRAPAILRMWAQKEHLGSRGGDLQAWTGYIRRY